MTASPIDFTVGLAAPHKKLAEASARAATRPRDFLENMIFLSSLLALAPDFLHFFLHAAGDHGQQGPKEHHHPANPHPLDKRVHVNFNDGLVRLVVRSSH